MALAFERHDASRGPKCALASFHLLQRQYRELVVPSNCLVAALPLVMDVQIREHTALPFGFHFWQVMTSRFKSYWQGSVVEAIAAIDGLYVQSRQYGCILCMYVQLFAL